MSHIYCPECGFQNPEASNYCARCGAALVPGEPGDETTQTFTPDDEAAATATLEDVGIWGPSLIVRAGGGRAGEIFELVGDRTLIGRSPDCDIFLDDVTVSRRHAVVTMGRDGFSIQDEGSLNGTFLNRRRIESARISDGDELQIGKYRLTFLNR